MQVKTKYKQTEIGLIPEDWDCVALGELGTWTGGGTPSMQNRMFWDNGTIPWVSSGDIKSSRIVDAPMKITESAVKSSSTKVVPASSILVVMRSGILRRYLPVATNTIRVAINQDIKALLVNSTAISDYLLQVLVWSGPRVLSRCLKSGTTVESVEYPWMKAYEVPVPPLPEQRAIATALSDVDALINSLDRLIAKKRDMKQATMQQLLTGKTRLPGFSGEWSITTFESLGDPRTRWSITGGPFGSNLQVSDYFLDGVRIIQLQNIGDGEFFDDYAIYTSEQKADELLSCCIYPGDIILSKMGDPVARACFVPTQDSRYLMASDGIRLAADPLCFDKRFVLHYINSPLFRKKAAEVSTGSTRQRIGLSELKKLPFAMPSLEEQRAIGGRLSDMETEINAIEERRDKTLLIKQGMMQELLTGRTRLV